MDLSPHVSAGTSGPRVFGASAIGPMHLQRELPCQDACLYGVIGPNAVAIAVADGLGSAARSETGARLAVESAYQLCANVLWAPGAEETLLEDVVRNALARAREVIECHASEGNCDLRDLVP